MLEEKRDRAAESQSMIPPPPPIQVLAMHLEEVVEACESQDSLAMQRTIKVSHPHSMWSPKYAGFLSDNQTLCAHALIELCMQSPDLAYQG